jgi:hypothetical protein
MESTSMRSNAARLDEPPLAALASRTVAAAL